MSTSVPDIEVSEWIRLLADACHNLPSSMRPSVAGGRTHRATAALGNLMQTAGPVQRDWILETLDNNGLDMSAVVS